MTDVTATLDALRAAAEARTHRAQLDTRLSAAREFATERARELDELREQLRVEEADVRRIEGLSPSRLWATLRGDLGERAARERAERDAAALAVAGAQARCAQADAEVARQAAERDAAGDAARAYTRALAAHEAAVHVSGGVASSELAGIATRLGEVTAERREVIEAIAATQRAARELAEALRLLESAGGWSTYDTFFGGGFVADMVKHGRIDAASAAFARVNRALEALRIELADIGIVPISGVDVSESLAVFDVLFDNILSDWMVRDRIARARDEAVELRVRLSELELTLSERSLALVEQFGALAARREQTLLRALS